MNTVVKNFPGSSSEKYQTETCSHPLIHHSLPPNGIIATLCDFTTLACFSSGILSPHPCLCVKLASSWDFVMESTHVEALLIITPKLTLHHSGCLHAYMYYFKLLVLGLQLRAEFHLLCYFSCNHYLICQSVVVQPHSQTTRRETLETRLMPAYTLDMKQKQNYLQGLVSLVAVYM